MTALPNAHAALPSALRPRLTLATIAAISVVLSCLHVVLAQPAAAAVTTTILRPDATVTTGWQITPAGTAAWAALDDTVTQPTTVPAGDFMWSGGAGQVTEVGLSTAALGESSMQAATAWFYANTGPGTRLQVDMLWPTGTAGAMTVGASTTVPAAQGFGWRSVRAVPPRQAAVDGLRLRFTALDGPDSNVRAAYVALDTIPLVQTLDWEDAGDVVSSTAAPPGWNE